MELEGKHPYPEGQGKDGRFDPPAPIVAPPAAVANRGDDPDAWRLTDDPKEKLEGYCDNFVKSELMEVLEKSKKKYATYAVTEFSRQFALFFGS